MKQILLFVIIFLNTIGLSFSQIKGTANFELVVRSETGIHNRKENYIVYFNNSQSIEFLQKSNSVPVVKNDNEIVETKVVQTNAKKRFIYKDFKKNKLIIRTGIDINSYIVVDTLSNFKWHISKEKKKILKFDCVKATANFRGRNYEAWFTDDIPIQNGPWKFCGLPGFIVSIKDEYNLFSYELKGIDLKSRFDINLLSLPKDLDETKPLSHKQFMALYNKKVKDLAKMSRIEYKDNNGSSYSKVIAIPEILEKY